MVTEYASTSVGVLSSFEQDSFNYKHGNGFVVRETRIR